MFKLYSGLETIHHVVSFPTAGFQAVSCWTLMNDKEIRCLRRSIKCYCYTSSLLYYLHYKLLLLILAY